jgi:hypothetical protein
MALAYRSDARDAVIFRSLPTGSGASACEKECKSAEGPLGGTPEARTTAGSRSRCPDNQPAEAPDSGRGDQDEQLLTLVRRPLDTNRPSNYERAGHLEHGEGTCRRRALAAQAAAEAPLVADAIACVGAGRAIPFPNSNRAVLRRHGAQARHRTSRHLLPNRP